MAQNNRIAPDILTDEEMNFDAPDVISDEEMTKEFESFRPDIYLDTAGKRTVGYGFNIDDPTVSKEINPDIVSGNRPMAKEEGDAVFKKLSTRGQEDAQAVLGTDTYDKLPDKVRGVMNDMAYNLGRTRFSGFPKMIKAIQEGDYKTASDEMVNSKWYGQVGSRSKQHIETMRGIAPEVIEDKDMEEAPAILTDAEMNAPEEGALDSWEALDIRFRKQLEAHPLGTKISKAILMPQWEWLKSMKTVIVNRATGQDPADILKDKSLLEIPQVKDFLTSENYVNTFKQLSKTAIKASPIPTITKSLITSKLDKLSPEQVATLTESTGDLIALVGIEAATGIAQGIAKKGIVPSARKLDLTKYAPQQAKTIEQVNRAVRVLEEKGIMEGDALYRLAKSGKVSKQAINLYKGATTGEATFGAGLPVPRQPKAGGLPMREVPAMIQKKLAQGITVTSREAPLRMTKDMSVKDVQGNKVTLPKGEEYTPFQMSNGQVWLHDGKNILVNKNQMQNVENQSLELGYKEEAPTEEVWKEDVTKAPSVREDENVWVVNMGDGKFVDVPKNRASNQMQAVEYAHTHAGLTRFKAPSVTKFSQYQLPGGENYRELVVKAPSDAKDIGVRGGLQFGDKRKLERKNVYRSPHWDEPNVLYHLRMNDRIVDGKKVLFVEEVQSDWAREARKEPRVDRYPAPQHPLLKNWHEQAAKKILDIAVREGYDAVSWTTGEQQAERYDLSKQVDRVTFNREPTAKLPEGEIYIAAHKNDKPVITGNFNRAKAEATFGKDVTKKIFESKNILGTLLGVDLKIGGEWAKNFYDRMLPKAMERLTGGKVENIQFQPQDALGTYVQPTIKLTPEIKDRLIAVPKAGGKPIEPRKKPIDIATEEGKRVLDAYEAQKDLWFGKKDVRVFQATIEKQQLQTELRTALGEAKYTDKVKDYDRAIQLHIDTQRNPAHIEQYANKLSDEQQRILTLSQNLPSEVKAIADKIAESYKAMGLEALDQEVIRNVLDNYAGRIWDVGVKKGPATLRKFGTTTRHAKARKFETIIEGWANDFNLKVEGATNNLAILKEEIIKTIEDKRFIKSLQKIRTVEGQPLLTTQQLEGYKQIDHPNFNIWKHAGKADEGKSYGRNFFIAENGDLFERRSLFAHEGVAKNMNNILGISKLKGIPVIDWITKFNATTKAWILQSSFFHHLAFMRSYWFGTQGKKWSEMSPRQAYRQGLEAIEQENPLVILGVKNGLTLGLKQDWNEELLREQTRIGEMLDKWNISKVVKDKVKGLRQAQADFLFGKFGAGLKAKAFIIEYRNMLKHHPNMSPDAAAKSVASLINDDFGGLHLQRMGRNPTVQHIFRLLALAPDWTESNVRTMVKAFKAGGPEEAKLYRRFWAGIFTKAVGMTVMANLLMAGFDEDDEDAKGAWQRFLRNYRHAWKAGKLRWLGVDITPLYRALGGKSENRKYFSILGHFQDPLKFIIHPIRSAHHKGSVVYKFFHEALTGVDWAGRRFTTGSELVGTDFEKGLYKTARRGKYVKGDPKYGKLKGKTVTWDFKGRGPISYEQLPSFMLTQIKGWQPIQIQNLISWLAGEMAGFDALTKSMGLRVSTAYEREKATPPGRWKKKSSGRWK